MFTDLSWRYEAKGTPVKNIPLGGARGNGKVLHSNHRQLRGQRDGGLKKAS